jgi:Pvc16 N-terminal domain
MSDHDVIQDTSLTLKALLEARLTGNGGTPVVVTVDSPHRGDQQSEFRVNLFLYNVIQDESRRNSGGWIPLERGATTQRFAAEPLPLKLYYLVTAFAGDGLTEHRLLGQAMQVFYLNRRIPEAQLRGTLKTSRVRAEHVEINLLNIDVDMHQKIWGSQNEPPRTSVAYEVTAVFLDALESEAEVRLVEERLVDMVPFPYPATLSAEAARPGDVVRLYGSGLVVPQPATGRNLVRIWIGGVEAEVLPDNASPGALGVRVPATVKPGSTSVVVQLGRYISRSIPLDVMEPA